MDPLLLLINCDVASTWNTVLHAYDVWMRSAGRSAGTVRLHLHYLQLIVRLVDDPWIVTTPQLQAILARTSWSPETRKSCRSAFRSFYGWAVQAGHLALSPADHLAPIRVPAASPRPAPEAVLQRALLDADARTRLMLQLAAFAGLRCAEIARVHRRDVVSGVLRVHGKGNKRRDVPLLPSLERELLRVDGWAFPGPSGHMTAGHVSRLLSRALPDGWTGHTLRHRMATRAYSGTRDLLAVSALLGHSRPETTQRYVQLPDDALRQAVAAAGAVVA